MFIPSTDQFSPHCSHKIRCTIKKQHEPMVPDKDIVPCSDRVQTRALAKPASTGEARGCWLTTMRRGGPCSPRRGKIPTQRKLFSMNGSIGMAPPWPRWENRNETKGIKTTLESWLARGNLVTTAYQVMKINHLLLCIGSSPQTTVNAFSQTASSISSHHHPFQANPSLEKNMRGTRVP